MVNLYLLSVERRKTITNFVSGNFYGYSYEEKQILQKQTQNKDGVSSFGEFH